MRHIYIEISKKCPRNFHGLIPRVLDCTYYIFRNLLMLVPKLEIRRIIQRIESAYTVCPCVWFLFHTPNKKLIQYTELTSSDLPRGYSAYKPRMRMYNRTIRIIQYCTYYTLSTYNSVLYAEFIRGLYMSIPSLLKKSTYEIQRRTDIHTPNLYAELYADFRAWERAW